jgi:nicotinamide-nucleotide amidase
VTSDLKNQAARVVERAKAGGFTLATAESCTAGSLGHLLSQAPGAGEVFHGGFTVYTKANKTAALGVPEGLLAHTAVSKEVAKAMAQGAIARCPADIIAAITGVAGPAPDEDGNPVGLVVVAVASRDGRSRAEQHDFGKRDRNEICAAASAAALALVESLLDEAT